jgi:hypothetical protein
MFLGTPRRGSRSGRWCRSRSRLWCRTGSGRRRRRSRSRLWCLSRSGLRRRTSFRSRRGSRLRHRTDLRPGRWSGRRGAGFEPRLLRRGSVLRNRLTCHRRRLRRRPVFAERLACRRSRLGRWPILGQRLACRRCWLRRRPVFAVRLTCCRSRLRRPPVLKWLSGRRRWRRRLWLPGRHPVFWCASYWTIRLIRLPALERLRSGRRGGCAGPSAGNLSRLGCLPCKRLRNRGGSRRGSPIGSSQRSRRCHHLRATAIHRRKLLPIRSGLPDMLHLRRHGRRARFA